MRFFQPYWHLHKFVKPSEDNICDAAIRWHVLNRSSLRKKNFEGDATGELQFSLPYTKDGLDLAELFKWLYGLLAILDSKASALMRLNGVMVAAASFLLRAGEATPSIIHYLAAFSGLASALSITCCLFIVCLDWRFLELVKEKSTDHGLELDFSDEFLHLQKVVVFRETFYRTAWIISFLAALSFIVCLFIFFF